MCPNRNVPTFSLRVSARLSTRFWICLLDMADFWTSSKNQTRGQLDQQTHVRTDLATQATISIVLGLSAFLTFCVCLTTSAEALVLILDRSSCDRDGLPSMRQGKGRKTMQRNYLNYQTLHSDGSRFYTVSRRKRCLRLQDWMLSWSVNTRYVRNHFPPSD